MLTRDALYPPAITILVIKEMAGDHDCNAPSAAQPKTCAKPRSAIFDFYSAFGQCDYLLHQRLSHTANIPEFNQSPLAGKSIFAVVPDQFVRTTNRSEPTSNRSQ